MPNLMQMFGSEDAKHDRILYVAFDWTMLHSIGPGLPFFGEAAWFPIGGRAHARLCVGANSAMFSLIDAVLLRPLPYPASERLPVLFETNAARKMGPQGVAPVQAGLRRRGAFFRRWGVLPFLGREFTLEEERFGGPRPRSLASNFGVGDSRPAPMCWARRCG